jgi:uncharacterized membrane protein YdbT with pleckstrin-like domain
MARYIDEILQPGEKVLYSTNAHWIFHLPGILGWILAAACLAGWRLVPELALQKTCLAAAAGVGLVALVLTIRAWFHRWITETDVTNLRVVHKTGFITRNTFEISLDKVESVDVEQGVFGRIFNYGNVVIRGVGKSREQIQTIAAPLAFRNSITAR